MHCNDARQLLDKPGAAADGGSGLAEHLSGCEACRDYARERRLATLLAELPVPEMLPGMEERLIQRALSRDNENTAAGLHSTARWGLPGGIRPLRRNSPCARP